MNKFLKTALMDAGIFIVGGAPAVVANHSADIILDFQKLIKLKEDDEEEIEVIDEVIEE